MQSSLISIKGLLTVHMEASMVFEMNDMDFSSDGKLAT